MNKNSTKKELKIYKDDETLSQIASQIEEAEYDKIIKITPFAKSIGSHVNTIKKNWASMSLIKDMLSKYNLEFFIGDDNFPSAIIKRKEKITDIDMIKKRFDTFDERLEKLEKNIEKIVVQKEKNVK